MSANDLQENEFKLHPLTEFIVFDTATFDQICKLLEAVDTYTRETGARVKYTRPELFASVCQTLHSRIRDKLKHGHQVSKDDCLSCPRCSNKGVKMGDSSDTEISRIVEAKVSILREVLSEIDNDLDLFDKFNHEDILVSKGLRRARNIIRRELSKRGDIADQQKE